MSWLLFLLVTIGFTLALPNKPHLLSDEDIDEINKKQSTWKAGRKYNDEDYEVLKRISAGVIRSGGLSDKKITKIHDENQDVPESFDAREAWPKCADIIGMIRDQSNCASCWAFSSAEVMSDRICIHSNATKKVIVSSQDVLTCADTEGCWGGFPEHAFEYWTKGIVSGGLYNHTEQGCKSFFLPSCGKNPYLCTSILSTPACVDQCDNSSLPYDEQKTYGLKGYGLKGEKQIQLEIFKNGPVVATMFVYMDFVYYVSGIYQRVSDDFVGSHAVKIIGWGVEDGVKYWLVVNSFNENWGENGYFRIVRGQNEARIEHELTAGMPDFSRF